MAEGYLSKLSNFVSRLTINDLGEKVITKSKLCILDAFASAYAGCHLDSSRIALQVAESLSGGAGEATVWVKGKRISALMAAFSNCLMVHSMLHDDMNESSVGHVGNMIIPAAIALGESEGVNGAKLIPAVVAGYEVMGRVGFKASPHSVSRGFRGSPTYGPFGVAAAAGKILELSAEQMENAISCAASFSLGLLETVNKGSMEWRFQNGMAVIGGMVSALSAKHGLNSGKTIMDGEYGFLAAFCGLEARPSILKAWEDSSTTLGKEFDIMNTYFKPYATCGYNQIGFEVAVNLIRKNNIKGQDIKDISIRVSPENKAYPGGDSHGPWRTADEALLSKPFAMGAAVKFGDLQIDVYKPENLNHPELLRIASLVHSEAVEGMGGLSCDIRITMNDGRIFESNQRSVQMERFFLNETLATEKLRNLSKNYLSESEVKQIAGTVLNLEKLNNISELTKLIARGGKK
jgi:2-methylcitrate dehydratase PrpD